MERALRKMVLVPTDPIRTAQDFLSAFGNRHAFRFDLSQVQFLDFSNQLELMKAGVEIDAVGTPPAGWGFRQVEEAAAQRPTALIPFGRRTVGVSPAVGGVVERTVLDVRPAFSAVGGQEALQMQLRSPKLPGNPPISIPCASTGAALE